MKVVGILPDGTYDDANPLLLLDPMGLWNNGNKRAWNLQPTGSAYIGFRVYVRNRINYTTDPTRNHTGWAHIKMFGAIPSNTVNAITLLGW
jgi:hypothetical protein